MMVCKKALEESGGDEGKAILILRKEGAAIADKKSERALKAGIIDSYVHSTRQVGVLVEVMCETDFVAKNEEFKSFVHNLAMHIAASNPADVSSLMQQVYIKNQNIAIGDYVKEMIQKFGENIEISRFVRLCL